MQNAELIVKNLGNNIFLSFSVLLILNFLDFKIINYEIF